MLGMSAETDVAQAFRRPTSIPLGQAHEIHVVLPLTLGEEYVGNVEPIITVVGPTSIVTDTHSWPVSTDIGDDDSVDAMTLIPVIETSVSYL